MERKKLSRKERIERNASWVVGVILVSIVLVVVIFYVRQKYFGPTFEYKGYKVTKVPQKGTTETLYVLRAPVRIYGSANIHYINLNNDPRELEDIPVEATSREVLLDPKPKQVYLVFDPEMPKQGYVAVATTKLARILGSAGVFRFSVTGAVTKSYPGLENKIATCDDSSEEYLVIDFRYSNATRVWVDEHYWRCVVVEGRNETELVRASDKAVLVLLGLD